MTASARRLVGVVFMAVTVTGVAGTNTVFVSGLKIRSLSESDIAARKWGPISQGFELSIVSDKEIYHAGDHVILSLLLHNASKTPAAFIHRDKERDFPLDIVSSDGKIVPLTKYGKHLQETANFVISSSKVELSPRDAIEYSLQLDKIYDVSREGTYTVTAKRMVSKEDDRRRAAEIKSNTVHITVERE